MMTKIYTNTGEYLDTVNKVVSSSAYDSYQELAQTGVFAHYVSELVLG